MISLAVVDSPVGPLTLAVRESRVCLLRFGGEDPATGRLLRRWYPAEPIVHADPGESVTALTRYFRGEFDVLESLSVDLHGTGFQQRVWRALRAVPAGSTVSYAEIARRIGAPAAVRAVGAANGANPVAVIIPCHRVIGASGSLTGYGGGLDRKRWLLAHESRTLFHSSPERSDEPRGEEAIWTQKISLRATRQ